MKLAECVGVFHLKSLVAARCDSVFVKSSPSVSSLDVRSLVAVLPCIAPALRKNKKIRLSEPETSDTTANGARSSGPSGAGHHFYCVHIIVICNTSHTSTPCIAPAALLRMLVWFYFSHFLENKEREKCLAMYLLAYYLAPRGSKFGVSVRHGKGRTWM